MQTASPITTSLFVTLVVCLAIPVAAVLGRNAAKVMTRSSQAGLTVIYVLAYLLAPALLAASGALDQYAPIPVPMLLVVALTLLTITVAASPIGARMSRSLGIGALVGFQCFRIPVELLLHRLSAEGVIPEVMTYSGWNFDILTGLSAAALGLAHRHVDLPPALLRVWNLLGLLMLINIVVIAALATPVSFRVFTESPANLLPSTFPFVWLPSFLVQLALLGHLLLFRRLRRAGLDESAA